MDIFAYIALATAASAATTDVKEQRIPNKLVFPVMLIGFLGHLLYSGWSGLLFAAAGWGLGLLVFMIPFAIRMMGAGDVKLMAAIGALMGWRFILVTAVYASLTGFFVALAILAKKKGWLVRLAAKTPYRVAKWLLPKVSDSAERAEESENSDEDAKKQRTMVPYGLCIFLGVSLVLIGLTQSGWPLIEWIR